MKPLPAQYKKQVESKRENMDEFNMIKENIVMFFESLW